MKYSNFNSVKSVKSVKNYSAIAKTTTAAAVLLASTQAQAFRFEVGEWEGYADTVFTASAAMRVENAAHYGTADPTGNHNLFRDAGDVYSTPVSLLTDFGMSKDGFGFLTRFSYTYDYTIMNKDCTNCERPNVWPYPAGGTGSPDSSGFHGALDSVTAPETIDGIADNAQNLAGNKFTLYDAFVYGSWDVFGGHPLNVRIGKQVINWGESNIQGGGISQMMNPTDLSKSTTPGTDVKETLIPQESIYFNFGFNDDISLEAYYTWNWRESTFIAAGTYFSPFDFLGTGYNPDLFVRGVERSGEQEPDSGGQYGINMHFIIPSWNYADLGIYYVRSHAFNPYIGLDPDYVPRADPANPGYDTLAGYQWIYEEDQDTYAITLNGEGPFDSSFALELNYKPDFYDTREARNLFGISGITIPYTIQTANGPLPPNTLQVGEAFGFGTPDGTVGRFGDIVDGYGVIPGSESGAADVWTLLYNFTRSVGTDFLGADKLSTIFDVSLVWIDGLSFGDNMDRINNSPESPTRQSYSIVDPGRFDGVDNLDRPITDFSWGYTAVFALEYNDVFANVNVSPTVIFVHNVEGYTPFNAGAMVENQRTIVSKVSFSYLSSTTLDLQYVTWLGTAGTNQGRDNVSIVFKRSF